MTLTHQSQYQPGASAITRAAGCTWTAGASGVAAVSGGRYRPDPDDIHDLLRRVEETAPTTPGWSIPDLIKALGRFPMTLVDHTGQGWEGVKAEHATGRYVILQGDSDQFGNDTCSGDFNGDHCIGIHPKTKVERGVTWWWINDPICPTGRWARETVLRRYASKLWANIRFASFTQPVPVKWHWVCKPDAPATVRSFYRYFADSGELVDLEKHWTHGVDLDCDTPRWLPGDAKHKGRHVVRITEKGIHRTGWLVNARFAHKEYVA